MQVLPAAFGAMASYAQFILWRAVPRNDGTGKVDKFPLDSRTGAKSDPHDPTIWLPADAAIAAAAAQGLGVGFVFAPSDPFFFIDVDDCLEATGQWSEWANYLLATFNGAAVEISQSGKGLHIFGSGQAPANRRKKGKDSAGNSLPFDLYTESRFAALTGTGAMGDVSTDHTPALHSIAAAYLVRDVATESTDWTTEPCEEWNGYADDEELIGRMLQSKSAAAVMGGRASIAQLWAADEDALGEHYPHDQGLYPFDHSDADMALTCHLAFWTGKDCERMDRLFRLSALCRDKWLDRKPYRDETILKAVGLCGSVYSSKAATPGEAPTSVEPGTAKLGEIRSGFQYLATTQQLEHFSGCTYVIDQHRVFTPNGSLLKPDQFKAVYGGYVFALDSFNDKTTKSAWEIFTESQALIFPRAHSTCFRPESPPRSIIEEEGQQLLNTYIPIETERHIGDPSPFLGLIDKLLPNPADQAILLAYMASVVQFKGSKFQWAPLLQGVQGNGKTILISCLSHAIGHRYTHLPDAADLGNKFNSWIPGNLFIGVEEIYVPSAKQEIIEALKPMITNSRIGIQGKGADQVTGDNRANWFLCCNLKDALRNNKNDRRYSIFFTAQQCVGDLRRDGMAGSYFPDLYNWLRGGGFAIVNEFLQTYAVPVALNPALDHGGQCHRAPATSSTAEAQALSMGGVEQEVLEAIDEGRPGFLGGWVSSMAFDRLLDDRRGTVRLHRNKRREILEGLGYYLHPGLPKGRVNSTIIGDNGKPRLYVTEGHIALNIKGAAQITKAYLTAQGYDGVAGATAGAGSVGQ